MLMQFLHRAGAATAARRVLLYDGVKASSFSFNRQVYVAGFSSNQLNPLGLKEGVKTTSSDLSPTMQMLVAYVVLGISAMSIVARYKSRDVQEDENVRILNMAKRAVVKDRRVFEAIGYLKEFERVKEIDTNGLCIQLKSNEGSFNVTGEKGSVVVHYRQNIPVGDEGSVDELSVECEDGTQFSALESYLQNQDVVTHQKSESLGNKMFFPVIGGVLIGKNILLTVTPSLWCALCPLYVAMPFPHSMQQSIDHQAS
ncbi:unnamed protein product [Peronospora belbahrii]|uniref:RING-type E3 ubiquitin transferase n=1 Tax=Peronospora belbahrii TaxID=622444 RepID=A0ABN8CU20_9STRA|nr:unnamed protein product [Peronospora belbahrii]